MGKAIEVSCEKVEAYLLDYNMRIRPTLQTSNLLAKVTGNGEKSL